MPYTMRGYLNHRRRYLLPDGDPTVSDDITRVPTGVFVGHSRIFSLDYLRSVYPFGGSVMSRLLRLRVPQDMTPIDRIHLAELAILDVHNIIGTTSASRNIKPRKSLTKICHSTIIPTRIRSSMARLVGYSSNLLVTLHSYRSGC
jgi:hypothetical protein